MSIVPSNRVQIRRLVESVHEYQDIDIRAGPANLELEHVRLSVFIKVVVSHEIDEYRPLGDVVQGRSLDRIDRDARTRSLAGTAETGEQRDREQRRH